MKLVFSLALITLFLMACNPSSIDEVAEGDTSFGGQSSSTPLSSSSVTILPVSQEEIPASSTGEYPPSSVTLALSSSTLPSSSSSITASPQGLKIYFIRHAQTVANVTGNHSAENENTFSDLGQLQVDELTAFLMALDIVPNKVIVSPMWRTQNTISPYLQQKGLTAEIWPELEECCWEDPSADPTWPTEPLRISYKNVEALAPNVATRGTSPEDLNFWNHSTLEKGLHMVNAAKEKILTDFGQSGQTLFIVGHYLHGNALLGFMRDMDMSMGLGSPHDNPNEFYIMNTGVQELHQDAITGVISLDAENINRPTR